MKHILLIGALYSQEKIAEYKANTKVGLQFAAQNLQESIIEGAIANGVSISVLSRPVLSTYPHGYKKIRVGGADFVFRGMTIGHSLGYTNLPFCNHPSISTYLKYVEDWYYKYDGKKIIWVYSLSKYLMQTAIQAKSRHPDIELIQIVPDLPRFTGCNKYYKMFGLQKRDVNIIYSLVKQFDKYVLLCDNMAKDLNIKDKPYIVMEGIFSPEQDDTIVHKDPHKTILYTGNLNYRYGIIDLLDAFDLIKDRNFRLWIRGNGSTESLIKERMCKDDRISLIPQLSRKELLQLQKKATLLVNPVSPSQEFSSYFFPSKTMDYLASGTPTIMHSLSCLPPDYLHHMYIFKGQSIKQMSEDLEEICNYDQEHLRLKGNSAKQFIYDNKLSIFQVKKMLDL